VGLSRFHRPSLVALGRTLAIAFDSACADEQLNEGPSCAVRGTICTIAGRPGELGFNGDGLPALDTRIYFPTALAWHPDGRLVIDDFNNFRVRALGPDGRLVTIAGIGWHGWATPGVDALETNLENVLDVAFAEDGTYYLAELHTDRIVSIDPHGLVEILAGNGQEGMTGDGGPAIAATFFEPSGLAIGPDGSVYVSDSGNHAIRAVRPDGTLERVLGDGVAGLTDEAGAPRLKRPQRIRMFDGRLLIADSGNHIVRSLDITTGEATILAGTGEEGSDGDGGLATAAKLDEPIGVTQGPDGSVYIADLGANRVRRVTPDGHIETIAGTGADGFGGDGGPAVDALLSGPDDVLLDEAGSLYIADLFNGIVRRIAP
jgi:sugar lactone lactonase YvrE